MAKGSKDHSWCLIVPLRVRERTSRVSLRSETSIRDARLFVDERTMLARLVHADVIGV